VLREVAVGDARSPAANGPQEATDAYAYKWEGNWRDGLSIGHVHGGRVEGGTIDVSIQVRRRRQTRGYVLSDAAADWLMHLGDSGAEHARRDPVQELGS
jgi:hypothetical protein